MRHVPEDSQFPISAGRVSDPAGEAKHIAFTADEGFRGAGVSPAFLHHVEIRKIAGETPALPRAP
jgi:hypothetical protein